MNLALFAPGPLTKRKVLQSIMATVPKTCKVILAESIARRLLEEVQETLQAIGNDKPRLAAFIANDDPAAVKYAEWSQKTCEEK